MAQVTSDLWKELIKLNGTTKEYQFEIDGAVYGAEAEVSHSVSGAVFSEFGIGNAFNAKLHLEIFAPSISKGARIKRYVRLKYMDRVSEWLQKGEFFVNRRAVDDGKWTLEAFDAMMKAEKRYTPSPSDAWPKPMADVVSEIAGLMGVEIDSRTVINKSYMLQYPVIEYSQRQILGHIAAAHGGNWIITDAGALYLLPLLSAPEETNLLVTEDGDAISFGGVRLIAG